MPIGGPKGGMMTDDKEMPKSLSGNGTIDGVNFKSGDGERYELKVESGKSYNLLSDVGIGLNGTYGKVGGETVLTDIALNLGGKIVTLSSDGTLCIDGKPFDKKKNNLGELVTENKDGTYTVKANGYVFELKASESGIRVKIDAQNARTPEGLWGVSLDGEKNTKSELQKAIKESEYVVDNALTFDYEVNNNIGEKYTPDLDEEELNALLWNSRNPQVSQVNLYINNGNFAVCGPGGPEDDAGYKMRGLQPNKYYNVFSDEGIQVNGKFNDNSRATELGFVVDDDEVSVSVDGNKLKVTVNGVVQTNYKSEFITLDGSELKINYGDSEDENYAFSVKVGGDNLLDLAAAVRNVGANSTRSTGLLGDGISGNIKDNGNDTDGAGYLRNQDGSLSTPGANMAKALREYIVDGLFDTESGRAVNH
jgi:hypothetical protein